ncbi:MAG: cysteine hydrolase [Chloroflexota bacterium]|nr:cysteine hydrolase [Chloroflexota bacterium]
MVGIRMIGKSALIVIDVQNAVVADAWDRDGVVERIGVLAERARAEGVPVIYVQHEEPGYPPMAAGADGWRIDARIAPHAGEAVVAKQFQDSFANTTLADTLDAMDVTHLVIVGAQSDACIRATLFRAMSEGWQVTLVGDCHTTEDAVWEGGELPAEQIVQHLNASVVFLEYPGRVVEVVSHEDVSFSVVFEERLAS